MKYLSMFSGGRKKNRELTIVSVGHTNIPPKEPVIYSKQTQTVQTTHASHDGEFRQFFIFKYISHKVDALIFSIK